MAWALFSSCDDNTETLGTIPAGDGFVISTDTFDISSRSIVADSVIANNSSGYLGRIRDPQTGTYITSNYLTAFHLLDSQEFVKEDSVTSRDENGEVIADSAFVRLYIDSAYGDTLEQMRLTLYELEKPIEENVKYYSNFDPEKAGYIRQDGLQVSKTYTLSDLKYSDSLRNQTYGRFIMIPLNMPYTDKNNKTYNNYGTYLLRNIYGKPESIKNSYTFTHDICPGFYIKITNGIGAMAKIKLTQISFDFTDTETKKGHYAEHTIYGTEEVLQLNQIINDKETIQQLADSTDFTYLKTPAGIFTEIELPVEKIFYGETDATGKSIHPSHATDTLNAAKLTIPRINNDSQDSYNFSIPNRILMVEKSRMNSFFQEGDVADNVSSFITTYSSSTNSYTFTNISTLITLMRNKMRQGMAATISTDWERSGMTADAYIESYRQAHPAWDEKTCADNWKTAHQDWNKIVLIPVETTYNSSNELTSVQHIMGLTSTKLVGGKTNTHSPIRMEVIFSKFNN